MEDGENLILPKFVQGQRVPLARLLAAVEAIESLGRSQGFSLTTRQIVELTYALHTGQQYEVSLGTGKVFRLKFLPPAGDGVVVLVFAELQKVDIEKTNKLNAEIARSTDGLWAE